MKSLKRFFLSRSTVISLICLMLGVVVGGYFIPQRFLTAPAELEKWQLAHPTFAILMRWFALDHVYTSPWFALILLVFLVSLSLSTVEQFRAASRRTFSPPGEGGETAVLAVPGSEVVAAIGKLGYLPVGKRGEGRRLVRHPWGYWGNFLLHLGIAVTIVASLMIVLLEKRGLVELIEGEVYVPGMPWTSEERGLISHSLRLPQPVRLDRIRAEFWENDNLKQLYTDFSFLSPTGAAASYGMHINSTVYHDGIRVFQGKRQGHAFYVRLVDERGGRHDEIFPIPYPPKRDRAGYGEFILPWSPYGLKAKYYADASRRTMAGENPELVLRLTEGRRVVADLSLTRGGTGMLGPYRATLVAVKRWAGLIFIDTVGMGGIFFGFFIIVLGGAFNYFFPPREFTVRDADGGCRVSWRAAGSEKLYRDEFETILHRFAGRT
ncbi:cytochrome c biogenesis protein ResB [Geobacter sp.]|uniref:cytochrome c biogenesis protein ResB n=1 Tax=Geobacter sp. TaxID=46610 RepID=UPI002637E929|nr:cytochrome c biogenesis protein ResB [Geobacter sp.]